MTEHPEHIERLIAACRKYRGLDPRDVLEAITDPLWADAAATNDWRNEVLPTIGDTWDRLSIDARLVAYLVAAIAASRQ